MAKTRVFMSRISAEMALAQALKERLQRGFLGLLDIFVSSDQTTIRAGSKWLDGRGFDIVHLVLPVHPRTGEMVFSGVDPRSNLPAPGPADAMPPAAFVRLLVEAKVRLVVLVQFSTLCSTEENRWICRPG